MSVNGPRSSLRQYLGAPKQPRCNSKALQTASSARGNREVLASSSPRGQQHALVCCCLQHKCSHLKPIWCKAARLQARPSRPEHPPLPPPLLPARMPLLLPVELHSWGCKPCCHSSIGVVKCAALNSGQLLPPHRHTVTGLSPCRRLGCCAREQGDRRWRCVATAAEQASKQAAEQRAAAQQQGGNSCEAVAAAARR